MKKDIITLTGLNKREIREKMHNLEEKGIYFGKCINKTENDEIIEMTFRVENQFMDTKEYNNLIVDLHDTRITVGAIVRIKSTGELLKLTGYHQFSRSKKEIFCTSDGRNWQLNTVYKRCEYVGQIEK